MASVDITIPYPLLTGLEEFNVQITNSLGVVVFSGVETNALFTVSLAGGSYVMTTTFDGASTDWCFTVSDCDCPVLYSYSVEADIGEFGTVYYVVINFDYSAVSPLAFTCPFVIRIEDEDGTANILMNSFLDFTSNAGGIYTKKIHVYSPDTTVTIRNTGTGEICDSFITTAGSCDGPTMPTFPTSNAIQFIASQWVLVLTYPEYGDTCHEMTVEYLQTGGGVMVPDTGTFTFVLSPGTYPLTTYVPLAPELLYPDLQYVIKFIDCCGNRHTVSYLATNY